MATTRCEVTVRGAMSRAVLDLIRTRFDHVSAPDPSVLVIEDFDQAAVRALLSLLWDAGHEVVSFKPLSRRRTS